MYANKGVRSVPGMADYSEVTVQCVSQGSMLSDGSAPGANAGDGRAYAAGKGVDGLPIGIGSFIGHTRFKVRHGLGEPPSDVSIQVISGVYGIEYRDVAGGSDDTLVECRDEDTVIDNLRYSPVPRTRYLDTWAAGLVIAKPAFPFADREYSYFSIAFSCYPWVSVVVLDSTGKAWISSMEEGGVILSAHAQWASNMIASGTGRLDCNIGIWNASGVNLSRGPFSILGPIAQGNAFLWGYPTHVVREIFVSSTAAGGDNGKVCTVTAWCGPQVDQPIRVKVISKLDRKPASQQQHTSPNPSATYAG